MSIEVRYDESAVSHGRHTHLYYEMLYVTAGASLITVRDREFMCGPGSLIFLNPFDEHASRPHVLPYKRYYLLIPLTQMKAFHNDVLLMSVFRFHGSQFPYVMDTGGRKDRFDAYFSLLMDTQRNEGPFADTRYEALMTLILTDARSLRPDLFIPANGLSFLPIQDILTDLDQSFAQPFSLEGLARKYHVSPGCLSSHFRRAVGLSPMQYVTQSRMSHAQLLLLGSGLSVSAVARQCGYADESNFVRRFRQQFGMTPLQYRSARSSSALRQDRAAAGSLSAGPDGV